MMKILVIYYSLTGNTQKAAEAIALKAGTTAVRLKEKKSRSGALGVFRSLYQALFSRPSEIHELDIDIAKYDVLILGAPVWAMHMAPALRSFILNNKQQFKDIAFFCTEGSSGGAKVFKSMQTLCGKAPIATLELSELEIHAGQLINKVNRFVDSIEQKKTK